jgi:threonine synthase
MPSKIIKINFPNKKISSKKVLLESFLDLFDLKTNNKQLNFDSFEEIVRDYLKFSKNKIIMKHNINLLSLEKDDLKIYFDILLQLDYDFKSFKVIK